MPKFDGDRMKQVRTLRGITQRDLASATNIDQRSITRYENGEADPPSEAVAKISVELGVPSDYLLGITDNPLPGITESDLSEDERRFIAAVRQGLLGDVLESLARLAKQQK